MSDNNGFFDFDYNAWDNLFNDRKDNLKVKTELTGETYLKEIDDTSNEFTISIEQDSDEMELIYNIVDKDGDFNRDIFIKEHGDTLKEYFNNE
jgi:hypothetical protein